MKVLKLMVIVCCLMLTAQLKSQTILIDYSASWTYYDNSNEPIDNGGLDWNDISYNASSWSQGNAHLGYGDGDETTVINSNTLTGYFRHNFTVVDPSVFDGIELDLIFDDGAVVYLNGTEIWRVNMPNGSISYNTFSTTSSSDNEMANNSFTNSLVAGDNVLAVEVHQASNGSSDISFDLKVTGTIPGAVNISRGPYLQKASASNMTVRYRTESATQTIIKYGTDINNLNQTFGNNTPKTEHIADISGLSPNTTYYYRIENSSAVLLPEDSDIYFRTHPTIGTDQPIRMWILGDCGTANTNQRNVRDAYYNYVGNDHTDGILFLGDNAYNDGTDAEYQDAIFSNMYEDKLQNTVAWSCLGNHDAHSANSSSQTGPYYDIFSFPTAGESGGVASGTEAYYSFDYGNIHFIALESAETDNSVGGAMYNWTLNDIQSTTQDWIVAFWHHPPYTKGSHDSDVESSLIDMRENFLPILESNGVDLVLSGHSHSYERSYLLNGHYGNSNSFDSNIHTVGANGYGDGKSDGNGVYNKTVTGPNAGEGAVYITTGSAGKTNDDSLDHEAMFYSVAELGSCVLEVNGNQLDVKFVRDNEVVEDYFTIIKEDDCVVGSSCDDGDPCTTNDVYNASCNCAGTDLPDTDNDGICDAEDQCPNLDDALIGTSCDDGDSQTENDIYGQDCICAGVPCSPAGTACDDNDPSTFNDITDGNCNCFGTPCPTAGTSCDDGDPETINDVEDGNCNCSGQTTSTTTCITINSGADDVEEYETNGSINSTSSDLELVFDAGNQTIGLRFNSVDVPQGATITNAYLQFTVDEVNTGTTNLTIVGEDVDNASSFGTTAYGITNRTKTQANVSWSPPDWTNDGDQTIDQQSTDIKTIIQEIVDRPGYTINNSMVIVITGTGERTAESYNGSPALAPQLCITYSTSNCPNEGNTCDDGDACTTNDIIDSSCNCSGTFQDADGDGVCANEDCNDNDASVGAMQPQYTPCNDGNSNTSFDMIQADGCTCLGTDCGSGGATQFSGCNVTVEVDGQDVKFVSTSETGTLIIKVRRANWSEQYDLCNDYNNNTECSTSSVVTVTGTGTYVVDIQGGTGCSSFNITVGGGGGGGTDADNDSVCDLIDCNDNDASVGEPQPAGTSCDDGDSNTTNDVIQSDGCTCEGTTINCQTDVDGDGICANEDCNDNDASVGATQPQYTPCNDGNSNTSFDMIQADGCTCLGTDCGSGGATQFSGCNVTVEVDGQDVKFVSTSETGTLIIKVRRANWSEQYTLCNDYNSNTECSTSSVATVTGTGTYVVDIQGGTGCSSFNITVGGGGGSTDADNDSVCDVIDCDDNDASVGEPQPAGTSCDDGNSGTSNDVILADGCTCQGTTSIVSNTTNSASNNSSLGTVSIGTKPRNATAFPDGSNTTGVHIEEIKIYPNPAYNILYVEMKKHAENRGKVEIFNQLGQRRFSNVYMSIPPDPVAIDLSKFESGIYIMVIQVGDNHREIKHFVVIDK